MDFKQELGKRTQEIETILSACAPKEEGYQKTIFQAMNYSLMAGGKRLRPMLIQDPHTTVQSARNYSFPQAP